MATAEAFYEVGSFTDGHFGPNGLNNANETPGQWMTNHPDLFAENVAGHALVGCASSAAGGGKCGSGVLAAGFSDAIGPGASKLDLGEISGLVVSSVSGGIGSMLGGGKFENGAVTGAFGYLFSECAGGGCGTLLSLGYNRIPLISWLTGDDHTFDISTDTYSGDQYATRSGPGFNAADPAGPGCDVLQNCAQSGPLGSSFQDKLLDSTSIQTVGVLRVSPMAVQQDMAQYAATFNSEHSSYGWTSDNSNSYGFTYPTTLGFPRPTPLPGKDVPGWNNYPPW